MKKSLIVVSIVLLLFSCNLQSDYNYYFTVVNDSDMSVVSYDFNGTPEILSPKESKNYDKAHYTAITNIDVAGFGIKVKLEKKYDYTTTPYTYIYTFDDVPSYDLNITNTLPIDVTIGAGNYIDNAGSASVTIVKNDTHTTAKIYTNKPSFTPTAGYPVIIDWSFNNNTVYVIIR